MDNVVDRGRAALAHYEATKELPELPEDMTSNDFAVWRCCFEEYPDTWPYFVIEENRRSAIASLENYESLEEAKHRPSLMKLICMLPAVEISHYEATLGVPSQFHDAFRKIQVEVLKVWIEIFGKYKLNFVEGFREASKFRRNQDDNTAVDEILEQAGQPEKVL